MGNYYQIVNFDKKERIGLGPDSWDIKWDTFANGGPQMSALAYLICNGVSNRHADLPTIIGRWFGDKIGIVGDFSEISDTTDEFMDITPILIKEFGESPGGRHLLKL